MYMCCKMMGMIPREKMSGDEQRRRVWSPDGLCPTILTPTGGYFEVKITRKENDMLRIRKLTEGECYRFMGFEEEDEAACKAVGQSKANIYHQAGDSIVTTVLMGIFGELLGLDYKAKIEAYADKLHGEVADE